MVLGSHDTNLAVQSLEERDNFQRRRDLKAASGHRQCQEATSPEPSQAFCQECPEVEQKIEHTRELYEVVKDMVDAIMSPRLGIPEPEPASRDP